MKNVENKVYVRKLARKMLKHEMERHYGPTNKNHIRDAWKYR